MDPETTAIMLIDLHREYFEEDRPWYVPDSDPVREQCGRMLDAARETETTVIHARHVSRGRDAAVFGWGSEYIEIIDDVEIRDDEHLITKTTPSCFPDTRLSDILQRNGIETVVCTGLLSFICVDTTARDAAARGYETKYVEDATTAFPLEGYEPEEITDTVATIQELVFSDVVGTDAVVDQL